MNTEDSSTSQEDNQAMDEGDAFGFPTGIGGIFKRKKKGSKRNGEHKAKMVVDQKSLFYKMDHRQRGLAVIFNHENFLIPKLGKRNGTAADRDNLVNTFSKLGFEVVVHDDLGAKQVLNLVEQYSSKDHSDADCFVMCVLSHGEENGTIFARDTGFSSDKLWMPFTADKCKTLAGKPKLFFFQACQGSQLDSGITMTQMDGFASYKIPLYADFLICYSTFPGFYSWRNTTKGSWFVQALCAEFNENGDKFDLLTLLTFVNRRVAVDFESYVPNDPKMHAQKQIPCINVMLTRLMKFNMLTNRG